MTITIIGCGHMGRTFAAAFIANGLVRNERLFLVEKNEERTAQLRKQQLGIIVLPADPVIRQSDVVLLAVKPQDFASIVDDLRTVAWRVGYIYYGRHHDRAVDTGIRASSHCTGYAQCRCDTWLWHDGVLCGCYCYEQPYNYG
jgi:hypothetical protein